MDTIFDAADDSPVSRLAALAEAKTKLAREEAAAVRHARLQGMSWAEIGVIMGVSKQALHKRFGRTA